MADSITFIANDTDSAAAERILDAFEERTGLESEQPDPQTRVYPLEGSDHGVNIVRTLTDIDADWTEYLTLESPA
jgi:hypothetical protein